MDPLRWLGPAAACVAVAHVGVLVIAGLILGMGRSPWNHSAVGLLTLAWTTPLMLAGAEVIRTYLARRLRGPAASEQATSAPEETPKLRERTRKDNEADEVCPQTGCAQGEMLLHRSVTRRRQRRHVTGAPRRRPLA
ncbi:MAG: hypothetical protein ACRDYA_12035 [Egibacteraceae bacterium]